MTTQRAIVLAAGTGSRLVAGDSFPKPLKPIAGVPLIVRILRTLQAEGIREAVVVLGYRGEQLRQALMREPSLALRLFFVENPDYEKKKNGVSLLAARDYIHGPCVLTMADHLYSPELVRRVRAFATSAKDCVLAVDHDIERCFDLDDATKVRVDQGRIVSIAKDLSAYNAIDTGVFRIGPELIEVLDRVYAERGDCSLSDGIQELARRGAMRACGIGDARWIDVDTPDAARRAEAMLHVFGDGLGDEPAGGGRLDPDAIELFAPSWVRAAEPYDEEHFAIADRYDDVARLMSNENPNRPSERVLEAILDAAMEGNRYPSRARDLRAKLATREGLAPENVILGAGSTELIDIIIRAYVAPGEEVVVSVPTFSMYEMRTRTVGGLPVLVPMSDEGEVDVPKLIGAITERTKLIFLCTPNNPTGTRIPESELRRILRLGLPTVIDEAYVEFARDGRSVQFLTAEFPNAIILRTFSKAYGLAGLRIGYALGHPAQIRLLNRVKVPWNVSAVAIAAASAVLDDTVEYGRRLTEFHEQRQWLCEELAAMPGLEIYEGEGNFVLVDASDTGLGADDIVARLLGRGVFIRSLRSHRASRSLVRISVGSPDQNRRCARAFREILQPRSERRPAMALPADRPRAH